MGAPAKRLVGLNALMVFLIGCATTPAFKPAGLSDQQAETRLNDVRSVCFSLRQGAYISVKFYEGAADSRGNKLESMTGYFDAFNKMNDTISIAKERLKALDRGEPYPLQVIADITPAQETGMLPEPPNILVRAVKAFLTVGENDPQRLLLTQ
ncbi:MAG: hypothetical protein A2992_09680 [Elusimicrobia bacterium RIFCSPLOWO2_01_FULL_59_12]|nr:MAG: hypothetical protein A2992_09680 [Elusimicrobia bacterium RIFCSPLOWO2_01_FULL_59_12]